jgi:hypothetical protein
MALFDAPDPNFPTRWRDFSPDYKLAFVYLGCMALLFMSGGSLSLKQVVVAGIMVATVLVSLSARHRRGMGWRWPGVQAKAALASLGVVVGAGIFEFAPSGSTPPTDPRFLPWHMFGFGGGVLGMLIALRVVQPSKPDFLKQCEAAGFADSGLNGSAGSVPLAPTDRFGKGLPGRSFTFSDSSSGLRQWLSSISSRWHFGTLPPGQLRPRRMR